MIYTIHFMDPEVTTVKFSYSKEFSDESETNNKTCTDFEDAEGLNDFEDLDYDDDLYGSYDSNESEDLDDIAEDSLDSQE